MTLTHTRKSFIERGLLCVIHYKSDSQDGKRGDREKKAGMGAKRSTLIRCKFVKDTLPFSWVMGFCRKQMICIY